MPGLILEVAGETAVPVAAATTMTVVFVGFATSTLNAAAGIAPSDS